MRLEPVAVSTRVVVGPDWLAALRPMWRPGDLVVCFDGQRLIGRGLLGREQALPEAILATLDVPVYVLSGGPLPGRHGWRSAARRWVWAGLSLGVIAGAFALQAWIQQGAGSAATALLSLSVLMEFGLVGLVHQALMRE
jgi:hypothetical protein